MLSLSLSLSASLCTLVFRVAGVRASAAGAASPAAAAGLVEVASERERESGARPADAPLLQGSVELARLKKRRLRS